MTKGWLTTTQVNMKSLLGYVLDRFTVSLHNPNDGHMSVAFAKRWQLPAATRAYNALRHEAIPTYIFDQQMVPAN